MSVRTIAFVGAGSMGAPMARRARDAGFDVIVCDRDQRVLDAFSQEGTAVTTEAAECATADVIIVLLANDTQIMQVMLGENGIAQAVTEAHCPIVCMMSTTLPSTLMALKEGFDGTGIELIDAPISGGIVGAQSGDLTIMVGGSASPVKKVMPLFEVLGKRIFQCGDLGSAEVVKIINNMICVANIFLTAEAISLAQAHGVCFEKLAPILAVSTGQNFLTVDAERGRAQYYQWARSEEAYAAIHSVTGKDLHLAQKLADHAGIDLNLLREISRYVDSDDPQSMERWMKIGGSN